MRFGIFSNINGDAQRLHQTLDEIIERGVTGVMILGNLISPYGRIKRVMESDNLLISDSVDKLYLDEESKKCLDILGEYTYLGKTGKEPPIFLFKGQNELDFLSDKRNRSNNHYFQAIDSTISFLTDYNFALTNGDITDKNRPKHSKERSVYIFNSLRNHNPNLTVCFSGDSEKQEAYEIKAGCIECIYFDSVNLKLGSSYVFYPSNLKSGFVIYDVEANKSLFRR